MFTACHAANGRIAACVLFPRTVHVMLGHCYNKAHSRKVALMLVAASLFFVACSSSTKEVSITQQSPNATTAQSAAPGTFPLPYAENADEQLPLALLPSDYSKMFSRDAGGMVGLGDVGPGSGIVVYMDIDDKYPDFDFIEVYTGESPALPFVPSSFVTDELYAETLKSLGSGKLNSERIVAEQGPGSYAAKYATDLQAGGFSDWFLPSLDEMDAVCRYASGTNNDPGTTDYMLCARTKSLKFGKSGQYWTSSHANSTYTWVTVLGFGHMVSENTRLQEIAVAPVRYFN